MYTYTHTHTTKVYIYNKYTFFFLIIIILSSYLLIDLVYINIVHYMLYSGIVHVYDVHCTIYIYIYIYIYTHTYKVGSLDNPT